MASTARSIKIYPGGNTDILCCSPWLKLQESDQATELWVDISCEVPDKFYQVVQQHKITRVVFYDWYHTKRELDQEILNFVVQAQNNHDCTFYTLNVLPLPKVKKQHRFDFFWNRCKSAYLDKKLGWHQISSTQDYEHYPIHNNPRSHKFLNLCGRNEPYRQRLYEHLIKYQGHRSNWFKGITLPTNSGINPCRSGAVLPARSYMDSSYVTCQIESQYEGHNSIVYTEKTYDHLIQGRLVLNFGPQFYYANLQKQGWKLPVGIDLSWDSEANTEQRFLAYLNCLDTVFADNFDLHDLFLTNLDVLNHNHNRLLTKPFEFIQE